MAQEPAANGINLNFQNQPANININFQGPPEAPQGIVYYQNIYVPGPFPGTYNIQPVCFWLPPGYDPTRNYDILHIHPAAGGNHRNWLNNVHGLLNHLVNNQVIQPVIAVAHNVNHMNVPLGPVAFPGLNFIRQHFSFNGPQGGFMLDAMAHGNFLNYPLPLAGGMFPHIAQAPNVPFIISNMGVNAAARMLFANNRNGNGPNGNGQANPAPTAFGPAGVQQIINGIHNGFVVL